MATCFNQQSNHGIMGDHQDEEDDLDSLSSSSSLSNASNISSNSSDFMEDATSSSSSSSDHISGGGGDGGGGFFEMSSLMQQLPFKRGLSNYYQGKSQSFTSLSKVTCLEDLAKSEIPCKKKMKSCRSYGGNLCDTNNKASHPKTCSKTISKKASRGSWSSSLAAAAKKSSGFLGNKPPVHPQRTSALFNQTPLVA